MRHSMEHRLFPSGKGAAVLRLTKEMQILYAVLPNQSIWHGEVQEKEIKKSYNQVDRWKWKILATIYTISVTAIVLGNN